MGIKHIVGAGAADWIDLFAGVATAAALPLGVLAAAVAYASYRRSAADAAASHVHGLFRDYLRVRMEWAQAGDREEETRPLLSASGERVLAFKLYTLEEIHNWVLRHRAPRWLRWAPWLKGQEDVSKSWLATIRFHLNESLRTNEADVTEAATALAKNHACYGVRFLAYSVNVLGESLQISLDQNARERAGAIRRLKDRL